MGIINWETKEKVDESGDDWLGQMVITRLLSMTPEQLENRWNGKIHFGGSGENRIELRKTIAGSSVLIVIGFPRGSGKIPWAKDAKKIKMSMNGSTLMNIDEVKEMSLVIEVAWQTYLNYSKEF